MESELVEIKPVLERLKFQEERELSDPEIQDDIDAVKRFVIKNSENEIYEKFHNLIKEIFGNVDWQITGTINVKLYINGCVISKDHGVGSCTPICTESIAAPNTANCEETVVLAVPKNREYVFLVKNLSGNTARIFVPEYRPLTSIEKKRLLDIGLERVQFFSYQMQPLTTDYLNLIDMPETPTVVRKSGDGTIILLILALVVVLGVIFVTFKNKNR